jgi:hypothetical protein
MRTILYVAAAAVIAAPAVAAPMNPLQRETAVWQAFKARNVNAFKAMIGPSYVGMYAAGPCSATCELQSMHKTSLRSFKISNFHSEMIDPDDMLATYAVDANGTMGKASVTGRYWTTSLWHRSGNSWVTVHHSEIKAQ